MEFFGPVGVTNIRTFIDPTNPNRVGVLMDVADMDVVMAAMETPAAAEAMAHDGVVTESLVILADHIRTAELWRALVVEHEVRGVQVHAPPLVAGMKAHGIQEILTFNGDDFIRYREISTLLPNEI